MIRLQTTFAMSMVLVSCNDDPLVSRLRCDVRARLGRRWSVGAMTCHVTDYRRLFECKPRRVVFPRAAGGWFRPKTESTLSQRGRLVGQPREERARPAGPGEWFDPTLVRRGNRDT